MLPDTLGSGFWLELPDAIIISCKGVAFAKEKGVYMYIYACLFYCQNYSVTYFIGVKSNSFFSCKLQESFSLINSRIQVYQCLGLNDAQFHLSFQMTNCSWRLEAQVNIEKLFANRWCLHYCILYVQYVQVAAVLLELQKVTFLTVLNFFWSIFY